MEKELQYSRTNRNFMATRVVDRDNEVRDLSADLVRFGAIALASEVETGIILGEPTSLPELASPIKESDLKKRIMVDDTASGFFNVFKKEVPQYANESALAITQINNELRLFNSAATNPDNVSSYIKKKVSNLLGEQKTIQSGNTEMLMAGSEISPFLREQIPKREWIDWMTSASQEQIVNFSQWYAERLKVLSSPDKREVFTKQLEKDYTEKINKAITEGWINPRHQKKLEKSMANQKVIYFSPFGNIAETEFAGARQDVTLSRVDIVALPTITDPGSWVSTHEFGHGFAGVDYKKALGVIKEVIGKDNLENKLQTAEGIGIFLTIINEGFNDHMTAALIEGSPAVISAEERQEKGISIKKETSETYGIYRDAFAALVNGSNSELPLTTNEMSGIVDTMVDGDFYGFTQFVSKKWGGREVIKEIIGAIDRSFSAQTSKASNGVEGINNVMRIMKKALKTDGEQPINQAA